MYPQGVGRVPWAWHQFPGQGPQVFGDAACGSIQQKGGAVKLTFHGHAAWEIQTAGVTIWIDPFLSDNPLAAVRPEDVAADYIVLSHAHFDHIGDTRAIAERTGAVIIAVNELATHLAGEGFTTEQLQIGGGQQFPFGRVKLVPALHTSSLDGVAMGREAGILLRDNDGVVLYHAGDTGLFSDMALIGRAGVDVALLPIGDKFTMGPEDAATAVELIRPRVAIPMHYNTWEAIQQNPNAWKAMVEQRSPAEVVLLEPGSSYEVTPVATT